MQLDLLRDIFFPTRTLGLLTLDGKGGFCTCEDRDRGLYAAEPSSWSLKVKRETAIPVGEYELGVRFSPAQGREVLFLVGVPAFNPGCVLVHAGNTEADTEGCVLVGLARNVAGVTKSRAAVAWLEKTVMPEARAGRARIHVRRDPVAWGVFRVPA